MPYKNFSVLSGDKAKDAKIIFDHGEEFFRGILKIYDKSTIQEQMTLTRAANVLQAFAAEIYFKSIICLEKGRIPKYHHLHDLFKSISSGVALLLQIKWDEIIGAPTRARYLGEVEAHSGLKIARDLPGALKQGSKGFELLRYAYEPVSSTTVWALSDLPVALRRTILDIQPTWGTQDTLKF